MLLIGFIESLSIGDKITTEKIETVNDISWTLFAFAIGLFLLIIFLEPRIHAFITKYTKQSQETTGYQEPTPYDELEVEELHSIVTKLTNHYRIIVAVYGVLLAFVVSNILTSLYINWSALLWTGWILALIIRLGIITMRLSDIIETSHDGFGGIDRKTASSIYAARNFSKHSLIIMIPIIALLPATAINSEHTFDIQDNVWAIEYSLLAISLGIIGVTFFVFLFVLRPMDLDSFLGIQGMYLVAIILIIGILLNLSSAPLDSVEIIVNGQKHKVPQIIHVILYVCGVFGIIMSTIYVTVISRFIYVKIEQRYGKTINDVFRHKKT